MIRGEVHKPSRPAPPSAVATPGFLSHRNRRSSGTWRSETLLLLRTVEGSSLPQSKALWDISKREPGEKTEDVRDATICPGPRGAHSPPPRSQLQSCRHGPELARSDSEHG
ncbi:unnamed protein product [Arctogadus glacialis]